MRIARRPAGLPGHAALVAGLLLTAACAGAPGAPAAPDGATPRPGVEPGPELMDLHARRDYFELRRRLAAEPDLTGARAEFLRAVVAHAFNDPATSNAHLSGLGPAPALPDTLVLEAREIAAQNETRLHRYGAAGRAFREVVALAAGDSTSRQEAENLLRVMDALADVPPQRVVSRTDSRIRRGPDGRLPVRIGAVERAYALDTGANLSTMMRSEADSLGLRVRPVGLEVGTSTGAMVRADIAVAPRVSVGGVELENVVFLVVPDALLTFGELTIPGIIGFPVLEALGEIRFLRGGALEVPADVPVHDVSNLALDFLTPLIEVGLLGDDAVCDFDTGANQTSIHLPFYERHRARIDSVSRPDTITFAGAGGQRRMPARILTDARLTLADTAVTLPSVPVHLESVATAREEHPRDCRLGLDALAGFRGYVLNFRSMTFLPLEEP